MAKQQDAIALLKADHRVVEDLFEQFEATTSKSKQKKLATQICTALTIHATIEEEIFYPALKDKIKDDTLDEAYVEHDGAKLMIQQIMAADAEAEFFEAKVTVLSEEIKHHVREEEMPGKGMFAQARAAGVDLESLGETLAARKAELEANFAGGELPPPTSRTLTAIEIQLGQPVN